MLLSALLHFLAFLLWPSAAIPPLNLGGSRADPAFDRPDALQVIQLAAPADRAAPQTALPTPIRSPSAVDVRRMAASPAEVDLTPANPLHRMTGIARTLRHGPAAPVEPREVQYVQAIAEGILPDWEPPVLLFGVVITARVYLDAAGDPTGLVQLVPAAGDEQMNRAIVSRVRTLKYRPARRGEVTVAGWAEITFVFCGESVTATSPAPPTVPEGSCEDAADPSNDSAADSGQPPRAG
jgi:hypothetical protein